MYNRDKLDTVQSKKYSIQVVNRLILPNSLNQVPTELLLPLNRLKQRLEVPGAESREVMTLDDLDKDGGSIQQMLGEQLEEVPTLVKVDQNIQATNSVEIFVQDQTRLLHPHFQAFIVCIGNLDELHATSLEVGDIPDDVVCAESDVLDSSTVIKIDVLFDLRLLLALGWLVDRHFDNLVRGSHHDTLQSGKFT